MRFKALRVQFHEGHLYRPGDILEVGPGDGLKLLDLKGFKDRAFQCLDVPKGWKPGQVAEDAEGK